MSSRSQTQNLPKKQTPRDLGLTMPAEWSPHQATWLAWPKNEQTWPGRVLEVQQIYLQMIEALSAGEVVNLLVDDEPTKRSVQSQLTPATHVDRVHIHIIPTVDAWIRDYGPTFLVAHPGAAVRPKTSTPLEAKRPPQQAGPCTIDWIFNAWGGKYQDLCLDNEINMKIHGLLSQQCQPGEHVKAFSPGIVLEGGSIEVNGAGLCLTTEQCLLNPNRNPHLTKADLETILQNFLGVEKIIWLKEGIVGDDTDGHIDDIARFVGPSTIVCAVEEAPQDENHKILQENWRILQSATDLAGNHLTIFPLPMPGPVHSDEGHLPASYANFYIGNAAVLVPIFGHPNDEKALALLTRLFPSRKVIGIPCEPLVWGLGTLHCVTQQQPT